MAAAPKEENVPAPLMPVVQPAPLMPGVQPAPPTPAVMTPDVQSAVQLNQVAVRQSLDVAALHHWWVTPADPRRGRTFLG